MIRMRLFSTLKAIGIVLCCITEIAVAQPKLNIVLHQRYEDAGIVLRIENSGIYGLRGITAAADGFILNTENTAKQFQFVENSAALPVPEKLDKLNEQIADRSTPLAASIFENNIQNSIVVEDGTFKGVDGVDGSIRIKGREQLSLDVQTNNHSRHYEENYPGNLAFSDVIGIDSKGYVLVEVQFYIKEVPLQVQRQVLVLSPEGELVNRLILPQQSYCTTERDLQIDASGRLYCLLTDESSLSIACWSNLTEKSMNPILFPAEFNRDIHYNNFLKKQEPSLPGPKPLSKITTSSRTLAMSIADSYIAHHYTCSAQNLAPAAVKGPDGDIVQTPSWLVVGRNAHLPYQWGGFCTIAQFDAGLASGMYAGDINTAGVSGYAVSVDCSGYVSRCWQLTEHYATEYDARYYHTAGFVGSPQTGRWYFVCRIPCSFIYR